MLENKIGEITLYMDPDVPSYKMVMGVFNHLGLKVNHILSGSKKPVVEYGGHWITGLKQVMLHFDNRTENPLFGYD